MISKGVEKVWFGNIEERNTVTQQRRAREREREEEEEEITQCEEAFYKLAEDILRTLKRKTADKYSEITEKVEAKIKRRSATEVRRKEEEKSEEYDVMFA